MLLPQTQLKALPRLCCKLGLWLKALQVERDMAVLLLSALPPGGSGVLGWEEQKERPGVLSLPSV